jgi:AcrR family transcriptional regulator
MPVRTRCHHAKAMADAERIWGGTTLEARRADRFDRLLDAGTELLGTGGANAVSVRAVCRESRLSERYFYESFNDREELLIAVHDAVSERARDVITDAVLNAGSDPAELARAGLSAFTVFLEEDRRRGRILLAEPFSNETLVRHGAVTIPGFAALLTVQIVAAFGDHGVDEIDAGLTSVALVGALAHLYLGWLNGTIDVPRDRLVDHATALILRAASTSSSPSPS